jgi:ribosomal protein S18 acetylase RimI-like enzyme
MNALLKITAENIKHEHICCAISDKKCASGYEAKKDWIKNQLDDGFVFNKLDVRGKVFIEYVPAEKAWVPVEAPGYMMINCFWVSGQYKGQGHGKALFEACLNDSKGMNGIVAVSSTKKQPFLSDKGFFINQGFIKCDEAAPWFEMYYLPLNTNAPLPHFKECAKNAKSDITDGLSVYYTYACPFTDFYVKELEHIAKEKSLAITIIPITSREQAQRHFVPHTIYSVFYNGQFVTQHILNENYFEKFITPLL